MDLNTVLAFLTSKEGAEAIAAVLGFFSVVARFTPTDMDNKVLSYVVNFVHMLGMTKPPAPPAA